MLWFGILALVTTGATWSVSGVVMGDAPRRGVDASYVQFFSALVSILVSLGMIAMWRPGWTPDMVPALGCYFFGGVLNFLLLQLMSRAMQHGPNGIIWGIVQSGMIFPFMMGVLFFGVPLPPARVAGMVLLLATLFLFGQAKGADTREERGGRRWLIPAFASFVFCGMQQCAMNLPSYYPGMSGLSPAWRIVFCSAGTLLAALVCNLARLPGKRRRIDTTQFGKKWLWRYVLLLQLFSVLSGYFLFYNGLDALARANAGALAYPLLVSSCLLGFFVYTFFVLKERNRPAHYVAFVFCLGGVVLLCRQ